MSRHRLDVHYSSNREDWATPHDLFATLDTEFSFTLDAAASPENAKCERYFTTDDDGLAQPWTGTVWCNPPYGRGVIDKWAQKAIRSTRAGATVVLLVPARTDAIWFQQLVAHAHEVRFIAGRVKFVGATEPAPFPSALVVLRPPRGWASGTDLVTFRMPTRHPRGLHWTTMHAAPASPPNRPVPDQPPGQGGSFAAQP